jgi:RIO kinase 1
MKIALKKVYELSQDDNFIDSTRFEKFKSRKRNLSGKKDLKELVTGAGDNYSFKTSDLEQLQGDGLIDELISIIKTGKEASGKNNGQYRAVKIYTDIRVRSFRKDDIYRQGRFIGNPRLEKAIAQGSETGLDAHQLIWVGEEFRQMKRMHSAGIPVPEPIAISGLTIVMGFIGTEDGEAAPRISDLDLDVAEAKEAFRQSLKILRDIVSIGKIHGDFSAFNILWHEEKAIVIDFPQVIQIENNSSYKELLYRDVNSLCKSFNKYGIRTDAENIYKSLLRLT